MVRKESDVKGSKARSGWPTLQVGGCGTVVGVERNETWRYKWKQNVERSYIASWLVFKNGGLYRVVGQRMQAKGHKSAFQKRNKQNQWWWH